MSDQQAQDTSTAATTAGDTSTSSGDDDAPLLAYDDRVAEAVKALRADSGKVETAGDDAKPASAEADAQAAREGRAARIAKLKEKERADAAARSGQRRQDPPPQQESAGEVARLRAELSKAQAILTDKNAFFEHARQFDPNDLVEVIRAEIQDPSRAAAERAKRTISPEIAELRAQLEQQRAEFAAMVGAQQEHARNAAERAAESAVIGAVRASATTAPHTARFLEKFGDGEFLKLANAAADHVPPGAGEQALLDVLETHLEQLAGFASAPSPAQASTQATSKPTSPAAAKAKTLSNSLASGRSSVVAEDDEYISDYDERVRRATMAM